MIRLGSILLLPLALTALIWAGSNSDAPTSVQRIRQWEDDRELVEQLVDRGLDMAAEEDPLIRAQHCQELAANLAREIRQAATNKDSKRVNDLGGHLQAILTSGVAENLSLVRSKITAGSAEQSKLEEIGRAVRKVEQKLEDSPNMAAGDMKIALSAIRQGRKEVDNAIQGKWKKKQHNGRGKGTHNGWK